MASMEKEVSFERKFTQMCVSTETNAICHDVMFCRPAAPASIESNELEHPQRVQSKSAETAGRPLPRQGRRSSKIKEEPCRKLGHATLRLPTFRYTIWWSHFQQLLRSHSKDLPRNFQGGLCKFGDSCKYSHCSEELFGIWLRWKMRCPLSPKWQKRAFQAKKKRHLSWCHVLQACSTSFNWIKRVRASAACWQQVWQRPFRIRPAATRTRFTPMIWWSTNSLLYIRQWHIINTSFWQLADVEEAFERNVLRKITLYRHDSQYRPPFHPVRFIADAFGRGKRS